MQGRACSWWLALVVALAVSPAAATAQDADGDGIPDAADKCVLDSRNATISCDTDMDGYGNVCDGDFNNSFVTNDLDKDIFDASFDTGISSPEGTDMNCNGTVVASDYNLFGIEFTGTGPPFGPPFNTNKPGPSGLLCAGTPNCF